jgi:hypothetical protein
MDSASISPNSLRRIEHFRPCYNLNVETKSLGRFGVLNLISLSNNPRNYKPKPFFRNAAAILCASSVDTLSNLGLLGFAKACPAS